MEYDLAKQLKDAGFPQDARHFYWSDHTEPETYWCINAIELREPYIPSKHLTAAPTLEELIEACGKNFARLVHHPSEKKWRAVCYSHHENDYWGSTPDEAIARLFLSLNRK